MADYRMLKNRVLCKPVEVEDRFPGYPHIIIPDSAKDGQVANQADVVAVGPDCDPNLKPGCWVLHNQWVQSATPEEGLFVIPEDQVIAILEVA